MLHPGMARLPCNDEKRRKEETPREEPDEMRQPVHRERHFVVVVWEAAADEAQGMFVDEVEVPEAVNVSEGGMIADGMSLIGVREAAEDVPRSRDGKIKQDAGEWLQFAPATPVSAEQQVAG